MGDVTWWFYRPITVQLYLTRRVTQSSFPGLYSRDVVYLYSVYINLYTYIKQDIYIFAYCITKTKTKMLYNSSFHASREFVVSGSVPATVIRLLEHLFQMQNLHCVIWNLQTNFQCLKCYFRLLLNVEKFTFTIKGKIFLHPGTKQPFPQGNRKEGIKVRESTHFLYSVWMLYNIINVSLKMYMYNVYLDKNPICYHFAMFSFNWRHEARMYSNSVRICTQSHAQTYKYSSTLHFLIYRSYIASIQLAYSFTNIPSYLLPKH